MNDKNTGGPAFPTTEVAMMRSLQGMTLRDYFAAKAMEAHLVREDVLEAISKKKLNPEKMCLGCYAWADMMLKAREV